MKKDLPVYSIVIDEGEDEATEVNFVALVKRPAIKKDFLAFSEQAPIKFEIVSEEKRILSGPLMLADTPIYRKPPQIPEEGYVVFSKETVLKAVQKFFKKGYQKNVNLMHDADQQVEGVTMFESWITDKERGILPMKGFEDAPDGSWFGSFKVDNDAVWADVKEGRFKGFSIEGLFGMAKVQLSEEESLLHDIKNLLDKCLDAQG